MAQRPKKTIAIVEDEADIANLIARSLQGFSYDTECFRGGGDLLRRIASRRPDACIVDLGLPDMDGLELVRKIVEKEIPVIVLTGRGDLSDRVLGLELGADDYICKPFEPRELVARINTVLRRVEKAAAEPNRRIARFAGWSFDAESFTLTGPDGVPVRLSRAESELLEVFLRAPNRVLTRDFLMEARGTELTAFDRSIDVRISRLRQKLNDDPQSPTLIRTVYGSGYLFGGQVQWESAV